VSQNTTNDESRLPAKVPTNAIVRVGRQRDLRADDPSWQRVWLRIETETWRSLAVIPAGDSSSLEVVHGLAAVAWQQRGAKVVVADLRELALPVLATVRDELRQRVDGGERVIIAMRSFERSPATATIAREADKSILCIDSGHTRKSRVRDMVREIGRQRLLGTILVHRADS
jgi:hypothetical protein